MVKQFPQMPSDH
uniref:Uncharacterized protein n=1 Tax=Anguilla anguilla TaxID=7936 RepID=A0A0E9XWX3_ANGAN